MRLIALMGVLLFAPPRVEYQAKQESGRDHLPAKLLEKLVAAGGAHIGECAVEDAAWLEFDLGGPRGRETIVATFRDGVAVFGENGALYGRFIDEKLRCGASAKLLDLAIVQLPAAPPAVLMVVRDDAGEGPAVADSARLIVFDGMKLKVAWSRRFAEGETFDVAKLKWDRKKKKFK